MDDLPDIKTRYTFRPIPVQDRAVTIDEHGDWCLGEDTKMVALEPGDEGYEKAPLAFKWLKGPIFPLW